MSLYVSDQNKVIMQFESGTYAVPSGTSGAWLGLVTNHEATENMNVMQIRYAGKATRNVDIFVDGARDFEGTLTYHPQDFQMLGYAMGSIVDSGATTPYTHRISEVNSDTRWAYTSGPLNPFASFTVVDEKKGIADGLHQARKYKGCIVDSWSLKAAEGEVVECEVGYRAQTLALGSKTTDLIPIASEDTSRPYVWSDISVQIPASTPIGAVKEVNFSINNNLEEKHYLNGSRDIAVAVPLNREYELTLTLDANSEQGPIFYNNYWLGGSTFNTLLTVSAITGSRDLTITMSGCKLTEFSSPSANEGIDEYSLTIVPQTVSAVANDYKSKYNPW